MQFINADEEIIYSLKGAATAPMLRGNANGTIGCYIV